MRIEVSDPIDTFDPWSISAYIDGLSVDVYGSEFLQTAPGVFEHTFTVHRFREPGDFPLLLYITDSSGAILPSTVAGGREFPEAAESASFR